MTSFTRRSLLALTSTTAVTPLITSSSAWGEPGPDSKRRAKSWIPTPELLETLPSLMSLACLPGLSMAVVEDGKVAWTKQFGVLNATTRKPVEGDSLFDAASASKPVFAYAVLRLADEKKIDLHRPLVDYYKPAYLPDDPYIREITAAQALSHTSGLPNWGEENKPESNKPRFKPGSYFRYSGEGYFWLQLVVEKITGQGLDRLVRTLLFEPAGMRHSTFAGDAACVPTASAGHAEGKVAPDDGWRAVLNLTDPIAKKWGKPIRDWTQDDWIKAGQEIVPNAPPPRRVRFTNAAASLLTTAPDYAKFLTLLMEDRKRGSWEVSEATRRAMISPQIAVQPGASLSWGLGWALEKHQHTVRFSHEGNNNNRATAYAGGDPAARRGMVVLANAGSGFGVYQRIVRAATGSDQLSFIAEMDPPHDAKPRA